LIELGEYRSWNELSKAKGFSQSTSSRYKLLCELEEIFVRILPAPSDMAQSYGEIISKLKKKNPEKLFARAEELLADRKESLKEGRELLNYDQVVASLKSAVRAPSTPSTSIPPKVYSSKDGKKVLKRTVSSDGVCKIQIEGLSESDIEAAVELLKKKFKMNES
jgi:ParB family chromosome partitioning protein